MFADRVKEARSASKFSKIVSRTRSGDGKTVVVPGHNGKQYFVIVRRDKKGVLQTECRLSTPYGVIDECKGNCNSVCYHSMAAVIALADDRNYKISICEKITNAKKNGGHVFSLINRLQTKNIYFTTTPKKGKK